MAQPHVSFNKALLLKVTQISWRCVRVDGIPFTAESIVWGRFACLWASRLYVFFFLVWCFISCRHTLFGQAFSIVWKCFSGWVTHEFFCSYVVFSFFVYHSLYFILCISFLIMSATRYALLVAFSYEILLSFPSTNVLDNLNNLGNVLDNWEFSFWKVFTGFSSYVLTFSH